MAVDEVAVDERDPRLRVERSDTVMTVSLARPAERNAQTPSMWSALATIAAGLDPAVRVVVLRGDGPAFSAGLHRALLSPAGLPGEPDLLGRAAAADEPGLADLIGEFQRAFTIWAEVPAIVIAAVQGHAIGAGFQLALAADLRLLADDARLALPEVGLGLVPDLGGTAALTRLIGPGRALELCATGRTVDAAEAERLGLANQVVPVDELPAAAERLVEVLLGQPPAAQAEIKRLIRAAAPIDHDQLRREREAQARRLVELARR